MSSKTPKMKTTKHKENRSRSSCPRDLMPEIFTQLHHSSVECLKSCLPNAQECLEDSVEVPKGPKAFMQLICVKKQMQQQLKEMKTDLITRGSSKELIDGSFSVSLNVARDPLEVEICSVSNKELALMRMQTFNALLNALQIDYSQRSYIPAVMRHSADTCKQILAIELENRQLEQQLTGLRRRRMEIRIRQQDLFQNLRYSEQADHNICGIEKKAFSTERENLESLSNEVIILQEVFQRIVMSVQLHWADNQHLKHLLMRMKDPFFN